MAFNYSPKIVTDGLVLYLDAANTRSYPGTGTTWSDLSRGGNNGILTNGPTFSSANGGSIVFDGSNDYVDLGNSNIFTPTGNFSISAWFRQNAGTGGTRYIFGKDNNDNIGTYAIYLSLDFIFLTSARPMVINDKRYDDGIWHHAVCTVNSSGKDVYIDGVKKNTTQGSLAAYPIGTSAANLNIGRKGNGTSYLNGGVAMVSLYNRVLTQQEVQQNFNATRTRFGI